MSKLDELYKQKEAILKVVKKVVKVVKRY